MMPRTVLAACSMVALGLIGLVLLHIGYLRLTRAHPSPAGSAWTLAVLMTAAPIVVWTVLGGSVPLVLRIGAAALLLAGCVVYVELRSLLSRGYSLRILLDVSSAPEGTNVERLRSGYGNGFGLRGMLTRRLETLARCGVVRVEGARIGPLTSLGVVCARVTSRVRHALRMEDVH